MHIKTYPQIKNAKNGLFDARNFSPFKSNFGLLNTHGGIQQNKLHLLMAPTHSGKSTLVRTLLRDVVKNNKDKKCLVWLTEESADEFLIEFEKCNDGSFDIENMAIYSEQDEDVKSLSQHINDLEKIIHEAQIDLLFIDNITTSKLYNDRPIKDQSDFSIRIKKLTKLCSIFIIAHTNGDNYTNQLLNENDIRGSKTITNLTQFFYILQPVAINNSLFQFVMVKKHRGQEADAKIFRLEYDSKTFTFKSDLSVSFDDFSAIYKLRNKLTK